jgi:hypothetical protein
MIMDYNGCDCPSKTGLKMTHLKAKALLAAAVIALAAAPAARAEIYDQNGNVYKPAPRTATNQGVTNNNFGKSSTARTPGQVTVPSVSNRNNLPSSNYGNNAGNLNNRAPSAAQTFSTLTGSQIQGIEQECRNGIANQFPKVRSNQALLNSICQCGVQKVVAANVDPKDYERFIAKDMTLLQDPKYQGMISDVAQSCVLPAYQSNPDAFVEGAGGTAALGGGGGGIGGAALPSAQPSYQPSAQPAYQLPAQPSGQSSGQTGRQPSFILR